MTPEKISEFALGLPGTTENQPYGPDADVYKVGDKSFAILQPATDPPQVTLKCEPSLALELRAQFPSVIEGYHVNKKHWNTVLLDGGVPDDELLEMIEHAYHRVVDSLPKAVRERLSTAFSDEA
jgi:predicted DNA-binding protein (MmcQ/YjbR family)